MIGYIYKITNLINGYAYIGQTIQKLTDRWAAHCRKGSSKAEANMVVKKAIQKYGKQNFTFEVLEECEKDLLDSREQYYIELYSTYVNGYNSTKGGQNQGTSMKLLGSLEEIAELYLQGLSLAKIADKYNVDKATIKHTLERGGIQLRKRTPRKFSDALIKQVKRELEMGNKSYSQLSKQYGVSVTYLCQLKHNKRRI